MINSDHNNCLTGMAPGGSGPITGPEIAVKTGPDGIAQAVLTLGQKTAGSPYWLQDTPNWTLAGFNQVEETLGTLVLTVHNCARNGVVDFYR